MLFCNSKIDKLLGFDIDSHLDFDDQVLNSVKKQAKSLVLWSIFLLLWITGFGRCPLVWLFCSRLLNIFFSRIHKQALRIVYNHRSWFFEDLLMGIILFQYTIRNLKVLTNTTARLSTRFCQLLCFWISKFFWQLNIWASC